ncbi:MAG: hypothetical protein ACRDAM_05740, partial [Casimicrobium sp.]
MKYILLFSVFGFSLAPPAHAQSQSGVTQLNPQPLPPKELKLPAGGATSLNPQPPPPQGSLVRPGSVNQLNPQPLPPSSLGAARLNSVKQLAKHSDTDLVEFRGKIMTAAELRRNTVATLSTLPNVTAKVQQFAVEPITPPDFGGRMPGNSVQDAIDDYNNTRRIVERGGGKMGSSPPPPPPPPPRKWVVHELPKERWRVLACDTRRADRSEVNHCDGSDLLGAQTDMSSVREVLASRVLFNFTFPGANGRTRAGGFHTHYDASNYQKRNGEDVYELRYNEACRMSHAWTTTYDNV